MRFIDIRPLLTRARAQDPIQPTPQRPGSDVESVAGGAGFFDSSHDLRRGLDVTEVGGLEGWPDTGAEDTSR